MYFDLTVIWALIIVIAVFIYVMPAVRTGMLGGAVSCTTGGLAISLRM